jgi:hypothetical protein
MGFGRWTIVERVQALTLHSTGARSNEILRAIGMNRRTWSTILRRAKVRGYYQGGPVREEHVAYIPKGKYKGITKSTGEAIVDILAQNPTNRAYSNRETADAVAKRLPDSGIQVPSPYSIGRFRSVLY